MRHPALIVLLGLGCGEVRDPPTTELADDSTGRATTTGDATEGDSSSSDATSSSDGSSSSDSGAASPAEAACAAWCAATIACGADVDVLLCELDCAADLVALLDLPGCPSARIAVLECAAALECEALEAVAIMPEQSACAEDVLAADEVCESTCSLSHSYADPAEATCGATFSCGPIDRTIDCTEAECSCSVAGMIVATCEGADACLSGIELDPAFVQDCCGWTDLVE
jgi:hypothetical protein